MRTRRIPALTDDDKEFIASAAAGELYRLAESHGITGDGLEHAAKRLNVTVEYLSHTTPLGYYQHPFQPDMPATIYAPLRCSSRRRNQILTHEIIHHLLHYFIPQILFSTDQVFCHEQDNELIRHVISRRAESVLTSQNFG
jgi:hypothetical protein